MGLHREQGVAGSIPVIEVKFDVAQIGRALVKKHLIHFVVGILLVSECSAGLHYQSNQISPIFCR